MLMQLHRVKTRNGIRNGRIESDNLKPGTISKHRVNMEMIGIVLDGYLNMKVL